MQPVADRGTAPGRRLRRCRARLRRRAGRVPGRGRPGEPAEPAGPDGGAGPAGEPHRRRRRAPAGSTPARRADRYLVGVLPGLLRALVRRDRTPGRGRHRMGRVGRSRDARGLAWGRTAAARTAARRPARTRPQRGAGGRGPRCGDELGHRRRVRPHAHEPGPAAAPGRAGAGEAQRPGTGTDHPGRPRRHQRPDRRPAVHQRPHGRLAPGPDPGQDRLPPPRRPDPAGPDRQAWSRQPGAASASAYAPPVETPTVANCPMPR